MTSSPSPHPLLTITPYSRSILLAIFAQICARKVQPHVGLQSEKVSRFAYSRETNTLHVPIFPTDRSYTSFPTSQCFFFRRPSHKYTPTWLSVHLYVKWIKWSRLKVKNIQSSLWKRKEYTITWRKITKI